MSTSTLSDTGLDPVGRTGLGGLRIAIANWRDPWHPQAGGAERYAWEMARALARARSFWSNCPWAPENRMSKALDLAKFLCYLS